jgi:hypothetical protein
MLTLNTLKKVQKCSPKKVIGRKLWLSVIKVKSPFFCYFFADNFFSRFFCNFLNGLEISFKFCGFYTHKCFF